MIIQRKITLKGGPADGQTMMIEGEKTIVKVALPPKPVSVLSNTPMPRGVCIEAVTYRQSTNNPLIFVYVQ